MKNLYESIFGGKESIAADSKKGIEQEAIEWLKRTYQNYYINNDEERNKNMSFRWDSKGLIIDYKSRLYIDDEIPSLTNGSFRWGNVNSMCIYNIKELKDMPESCDLLDIVNIPITSLKGIPKRINSLSISGCDNLKSLEGLENTGLTTLILAKDDGLKNLKGLPRHMNHLDISNLKNFESFEGCPETISRYFMFQASIDNKLTSFQGGPQEVGIEFQLILPEKVNITDFSGIGTVKDVKYYLGGGDEKTFNIKKVLKSNMKITGSCKKMTNAEVKNNYKR